ncbi:hypothetical protein [Piscibacillus salipiscarius]|uniref:Uncharacterized protein n=1 Tax=Piscibacillus salipiscarius TaxID=299480 RepID=A0ABW5QDQ4_9BACI|nr:hypothetical protein [Piscibacillus salipiscarius]
MSLTSKLNAKNQKDKHFKNILLSVAPSKQDFFTQSGLEPFSRNYNYFVVNELNNTYDSGLVGTAFDYLARFRISKFINKNDAVYDLVALKGFDKLKRYRELDDDEYLK